MPYGPIVVTPFPVGYPVAPRIKALRRLNVVGNHIPNDYFEAIVLYLRNNTTLVEVELPRERTDSIGEESLD